MAQRKKPLLSSTHVDALCGLIGTPEEPEPLRLRGARVAYADFVYFLETVARNDRTRLLTLNGVEVIDGPERAWLSLGNLFRVSDRITEVYMDDCALSDTVLSDLSAALARSTRIRYLYLGASRDWTAGGLVKCAENLASNTSLRVFSFSGPGPGFTSDEMVRYSQAMCDGPHQMVWFISRPCFVPIDTMEDAVLREQAVSRVHKRWESNNRRVRGIIFRYDKRHYLGDFRMARASDDATTVHWTWQIRGPYPAHDMAALRSFMRARQRRRLAPRIAWDSSDAIICNDIGCDMPFDVIEWIDIPVDDALLALFVNCRRLKTLTLTQCNIKGASPL